MLLDKDGVRFKELLREFTRRPGMREELTQELDLLFLVLRDYAYFVGYQQRELCDQRQQLDSL